MTITIGNKFTIANAKSKGIDNHEVGTVPFVTNGTNENGIIGFVKPLKGERVFKNRAICVSSFCEATVQNPPFLPRGNGGSGLTVLIPKIEMSYADLYFYASQINLFKWKFSFGRMVIAERLRNLPIVESGSSRDNVEKKLISLVKEQSLERKINLTKEKVSGRIDTLFNVTYGQKEYEDKEDLEPGKTILISSKGENKGCYGFFNIKAYYQAPIITVPRTGTIGHAFVQEFDCCANSDCLVLQPKKGIILQLNDLYQIAFQIRNIKWKFNYGRKITPERLKKEPVVYFRSKELIN